MRSHWLMQKLQGWEDRPALIWRNEVWSYRRLCDAVESWTSRIAEQGIAPGATLAICGDYSPKLCALLIASLLNRNIVVPLASATVPRREKLLDLAEVRFVAEFDDEDTAHISSRDRAVEHPLLRELADRGSAGLILFSSGSTGESKASVLDFDKILAKFQGSRPSYRTLVFLLLDHIGGVNTPFHLLCPCGTLVTTPAGRPETVCAAVEAPRIQLLPTPPTFLRMLLIADAIKRHDLTSLEIVTYGTEPMPATTLTAVREALPWIRLKQTYGLSELGILSTQS